MRGGRVPEVLPRTVPTPAVLFLLGALAGCADFFTDPDPADGVRGLEIIPRYDQVVGGGVREAFNDVDGVRVVLLRDLEDPVLDTLLPASPGADGLRVRVPVPEDLVGPVLVAAELRRRTDPLFQGAGEAVLAPGRSGSVEIDILPVPVDVQLDVPSVTLNAVGDTLSVRGVSVMATGDTIGAFPYTWTSLDPSVAGVDPGGWVQARGVGTTQVIASADVLGQFFVADTATVTVVNPFQGGAVDCPASTVTSLLELRALAGQNCSGITGTLTVSGAEVVDLGAFYRLESVNGDLEVMDNANLQYVSFPQLEGVGGALEVVGNDSLFVASFPNLPVVGGLLGGAGTAIRIADNPELYGVYASVLRSVGGDRIQVLDNPELIDLGFSALTTFIGTLEVQRNPLLCASLVDALGAQMGLSVAEIINSGNDEDCPPLGNLPPVALPGGPYTGVVDGQPVTFNGSASYDPDGTITDWTWYVAPDGLVLTGPTPQFSCTQLGTFDVDLYVTDDGGLQGWGQTTILCQAGGSGQPPSPVVELGVGGGHACLLDEAGDLYCWGYNFFSQLGDGTTSDRSTPVGVVSGITWGTIALGREHTCSLDGGSGSQQPYCWGRGTEGQMGDGVADNNPAPAAISEFLFTDQVATGDYHSCAYGAQVGIWCWGSNANGQVGTGQPTTAEPVPQSVAGTWSSVAAGGVHTCALDDLGAAWCWGNGASGQLGNAGAGPIEPSPIAVDGQLFFSELTAGFSHTCGLDDSGQAWCWGANTEGRLGTGDQNSSSTPRAVDQGSLVFRSIEAGAYHTCALDQNGWAYCWGENGRGELGVGDTTDRPSPVFVTDLVSFDTLAAGEGLTCGLASDGLVYCWGANSNGGVGDGTTTDRLFPTRVLPWW